MGLAKSLERLIEADTPEEHEAIEMRIILKHKPQAFLSVIERGDLPSDVRGAAAKLLVYKLHHLHCKPIDRGLFEGVEDTCSGN